MYEHRSHAPITRAAFRLRMLRHAGLASLVVAGSLAIGMVGFRISDPEHVKDWYDAFVTAAMLLGGMGPFYEPASNAGKVFAGLFALYCGLVLLVVIGLLFAPVLHRLLHRFHWGEPGEGADRKSRRS